MLCSVLFFFYFEEEFPTKTFINGNDSVRGIMIDGGDFVSTTNILYVILQFTIGAENYCRETKQ